MDSSVVTYNILNPFHAIKWKSEVGLSKEGVKLSKNSLRRYLKKDNKWQKYSNWEERREALCKNILQAKPAYVCLQEISEETLKDLCDILDPYNYTLAHVAYHYSLETIQTHGVAVLYDTTQAELLQSGSISHYQTEEKYRVCAWASFQDLKSEKKIKIGSVHLKGYDPFEAKSDIKESDKQMGFDELKTYADRLLNENVEGLDGVIIAGDFNEDVSEDESPLYRMRYLEERGFKRDENQHYTEPSTQRRIDWIYYKPLSRSGISRLAALTLENTQSEVSDHLITGTKLYWDV